jgi:DNA end-binding protein Ku
MINKGTNNRLKQQYVDAVTGDIVAKENTLKGYEYSKGQYVIFNDEEVKALEGGRSNIIDILEFVPLSTVDLIAVEKSYYLGPDKGSDKAYLLLGKVLDDKNVVAVGRWSHAGKDELVIVRPYNGGLILHQMFYANEVRPFGEIVANVTKVNISDREADLAGKLVDQLSCDSYDASKYHDEYVGRVTEAVQLKLAGSVMPLPLEAPKTAPIKDLFAMLEASIDAAKKQLPAKTGTDK